MALEPVPAPALGYSILANLGDEKQITVQCFADSEEDITSIHSKVDKAMAVVDRQKAKYRRADLLKQVDEMETTQRRQKDDLARLESEFEASQEKINDRIAELQKECEDIQAAAYGRGRAGPVGQDKASSNAKQREIGQLLEQRNKAAAERAQARENIAVNIGRFDEEIAKAKAKIVECDELIGGGG